MTDPAQPAADWVLETAAEWSDRVQDSRAAMAEPGSALDGVEIMPGFPLGRLVWRAIGTAGEHVGAMSQTVQLTKGGVLAKPYLSLSRATALGASRAIYVLSPESPQMRISNALRLLNTEFDDLVRLAKDWQQAGMKNAYRMLAIAQQWKHSCEEALTSYGHKPGSIISETNLLLAAAPALADGTSDPRLALMHHWRLSSSNAHSRMWAWDEGLEDCTPTFQLAQIWSVPLRLLEHAWTLWEERRSAV